MQYKSKYFNIDKYYENIAKLQGWQKEDFIWTLKILESLPKNELLKICKYFENKLQLTPPALRWEDLQKDKLIDLILSEIHPQIVIRILNDLNKN